MGNRKLRKQCAAIFRKRGWGRLYRKLSLRQRSKYLSPHTCHSIIYLDQFNVGDVVYDYTSNFVITEMPPPRICDMGHWHGRGNGWVKFEIEQFKYHNGYLSCGCGWCPSPPLTREHIESFYVKWEASEWGDPNDPTVQKRLAAIQGGQHICDERGVFLPEFERNFGK